MCFFDSDRPKALLFLLQVPVEVRQARRDELVSLQQDIGQDFAQSLIGREVIFN